MQLASNADVVRRKAQDAGELITRSGKEVGRLLVATVDGLKGLIGNFDAAKESVSSPVAVVAVGSQVARESPAGVHSYAVLPVDVVLCSLLADLAQHGNVVAVLHSFCTCVCPCVDPTHLLLCLQLLFPVGG